MKKLILIIFLGYLISSCSPFNSKEEESIKLVQMTEVKFNPTNWAAKTSMDFHPKGNKMTWLDYANILGDEENCKKNNWVSRYRWSSTEAENSLFIVSYLDVEYKTGLNWEVDLKASSVKYINDDKDLRNKYHINDAGKMLIKD